MASKTTTHQIGEPFVELQSIGSTNNYAFDMIQAKLAAPGMAIFAHEQTKGKGQRGKIWMTEKGSNIILSIVLKPSRLQLHQQFYLSIAMALAGLDFLRKYIPENVFIKWPNDLYWNDKKAGGILIETKVGKPTHSKNEEVEILWAVVGYGININQEKFSADLKNPVSLKQIIGKTFSPINLAKELCLCVEKRYVQLQKNKFELLLKEYNENLFMLNKEVKLKQKNISFKRIIKGVDKTGKLLVNNTFDESYEWGEVEWVI